MFFQRVLPLSHIIFELKLSRLTAWYLHRAVVREHLHGIVTVVNVLVPGWPLRMDDYFSMTFRKVDSPSHCHEGPSFWRLALMLVITSKCPKHSIPGDGKSALAPDKSWPAPIGRAVKLVSYQHTSISGTQLNWIFLDISVFCHYGWLPGFCIKRFWPPRFWHLICVCMAYLSLV